MAQDEGAGRRNVIAPIVAVAGTTAALAGLNRLIDIQAGSLPEQLPADPQEYESRFGRRHILHGGRRRSAALAAGPRPQRRGLGL